MLPPLQIATIAALSYALYNAVTCPCDSYLKCHKYPVAGASVFAAAVALAS